MRISKGINQNVHPEAIPEGQIYWAKNAVLNEKFDAYVNEKGNSVIFDLVPLGIKYTCGQTSLVDKIILFYKDTANNDCIAILDEFTKTKSVRVLRTDLGFDYHYPIKAKAKYNPDNQIVVAFIQEGQTPKYINLDTAAPTDAINFYNLFPNILNPSSISGEILDGGSIASGTYFFTAAYIAKDRTVTSYTTISDPVYVTSIDTTQGFKVTPGVKSGTVVAKSIKVTIADIDTTYSKLSIGVIANVNGTVSQKIIKEIAISGSTISFVYGGSEFVSDVTLDTLVTDNVVYTSAKHITVVGDQLFLADLQTRPVYDYQSLVNQSVVKFVSTTDFNYPVATTSRFKDGNKKTFQHDEVYALYVQVELTNGQLTDWFHLPGRAPGAGETSPSGLSTGGLVINGRTPYTYEIEDTSAGTYSTSTLSSVTTVEGTMGFWQNDNETYPNTARWGTLAGQKVRHHRLPSIEKLAGIIGDSRYAVSCLDTLNIKIQNNALFSRPEVRGYRIGYAKRDLTNVGVLGMGLTTFPVAPQGGDNTITGASLSFDSKTLLPGVGNFYIGCANGADDDMYPNTSYLRFNSFDLFQDRPSITGGYLRNYVKLRASNLTPNIDSPSGLVSGTGAVEGRYGLIFPGSSNVKFVSYAIDFTYSSRVTRSTVTSADKVRKLSNAQYVPNNVKYSKDGITVNNYGGEETMLAKIEGSPLSLALHGVLITDSAHARADANLEEEVYLAAIKNPKSDFFLGYESQTIVASSTFIRNSAATAPHNCGDGFIGVSSYINICPYNPNVETQIHEDERIVNFHMHLSSSRHNPGMRYQTTGDYSTYFYPDAGLLTFTWGVLMGTEVINQVGNYWFYTYSRKSPWNQVGYSKDFSAVQRFETSSPYVESVPKRSIFKYRIARSLSSSRDISIDDGWKSFKLLDYFDTVANKGDITNLEAWGTDSLLIHHKAALYRTRDKAVLQTNIISVSLGSGDIFALEPQEQLPTPEGVGGTQHSFACKLTDAGYIYVDAETKKVFRYDGSELKDMSEGARGFFLKYLGCANNNPYLFDQVDRGISIAFDMINNRLLLTQKATNSFTLSYDMMKGEWASSHDYVPDFIFNTRTNVYHLKDNQLYTANTGDRGRFFGTVYPFYVDFVVNNRPDDEKILEWIKFLCKVKDTAGNVLPRKTITSITIWNDQFCTGKIDIVTNETESLFVESNCKVVDEEWEYNDINDQVLDPELPFIDTLLNDSRPIDSNIKTPVWYDTENIRGKYFIVRLEYSNIENKEVHLREIEASTQLSA